MKAIYFFLIWLLLFSCGNPEKVNTKGKDDFPNLKVQLVTTGLISSSLKEVKDGPAVIFIFDPDCPHCQDQLNDIVSNLPLLGGIHIYMITYASYDRMSTFYKQFKIFQYPIISIWRDTTKYSIKHFKISAVPFIAVFDKNHQLKKSFFGKVETKTIVNAINE